VVYVRLQAYFLRDLVNSIVIGTGRGLIPIYSWRAGASRDKGPLLLCSLKLTGLQTESRPFIMAKKDLVTLLHIAGSYSGEG